MRYLVTPYDGVEQWLQGNNIAFDQRLEKIDAIDVAPGDCIIGQLDIQQVKMLNRKRADYEHLLVDLPKGIDPEKVTPQLLDSYNAKISKTYVSLAGEGRWAVFKRKTRTQWLKCISSFSELERKPIAIWFYTTASLLCFAWFGDMLSGSHLFQWVPYIGDQNPSPKEVDIFPTAISFLCYAFFSAQLIRVGKKLLPPIRKIRVTDTKKPKKVLVHTLSVYHALPEKLATGEWQITISNRNSSEHASLILSGDLQHDIKELTKLEKQGFSWNGTQLLRALSAHIDRLELLVLIGTKPDNRSSGSFQYAAPMKSFLASFLNSETAAIQIEQERLDAINVSDAYSTLNDILERIAKETHYSNKNMCVDITGATAAISCACAMVTLHSNAQFQYVTTDGQGKVYQQDLMYITSPAKVTP
ncbi:CRISPR-associated protein Csx16 [Vibrio sinaloensis]|uniref:CRISPR-associated protein Csx16 n=1 Tax=Photobacterium sp. (strain ATCC 43367) TaxID=379097 RepID=UPI002F42394F